MCKLIYQRDAQRQHEVAVKHTYSTGKTGGLKRKWRLVTKNKTGEKKERKERKGMGATQVTLELIYCGLFPGFIAAGCFFFRQTEIVIGQMYVPDLTYSDVVISWH